MTPKRMKMNKTFKTFYPGSKQELRTFSEAGESPAEDDLFFLDKPIIKLIQGEPTELFTVGQLALALNRKSGTIRLWERNGTIPKPVYTVQKDNKYAKRRLYTRPQVEGLRKIAIEEGILTDTTRHISKTKFADRAKKLFIDLMYGRSDTVDNPQDQRIQA